MIAKGKDEEEAQEAEEEEEGHYNRLRRIGMRCFDYRRGVLIAHDRCTATVPVEYAIGKANARVSGGGCRRRKRDRWPSDGCLFKTRHNFFGFQTDF